MPCTSSVVLTLLFLTFFFFLLFGRQEELLFLTLTRTNQFHSQGTYTKGLQGWEKNLRNGVGY